MKNRQLDATLQSAGLGVASIRDLATSVPINVVAVSPEIIEKIGAPFIAATIPAGTYEGQTEDVSTAAVGNFLVSHIEVSEETAYQMTKLLFENLDKMAASHAAAKAIDVERALDGMPVPLHPGAERYYREVGVLK
jgi:TRAP transporter TAXI family solute receptor